MFANRGWYLANWVGKKAHVLIITPADIVLDQTIEALDYARNAVHQAHCLEDAKAKRTLRIRGGEGGTVPFQSQPFSRRLRTCVQVMGGEMFAIFSRTQDARCETRC